MDNNNHDTTLPEPPAQLLPFFDRLWVQVALGDKLLFQPSAATPMLLDLVDASPVLDPQAPPGVIKLTFTMAMHISAQPGSQLPGFLVGSGRSAPAAPVAPPPSNLIVMPGGTH